MFCYWRALIVGFSLSVMVNSLEADHTASGVRETAPGVGQITGPDEGQDALPVVQTASEVVEATPVVGRTTSEAEQAHAAQALINQGIPTPQVCSRLIACGNVS